ncbi:MAG: H/ACA ribonucleoprotein complex subunit GAR1 [Thermoproteota archaeon]
MNRKGVVENVLGRVAVVKIDGLVRLGIVAMDVNRQSVGNVADIIGPVKEPYAVVVLKKGCKNVRRGDVLLFRTRRG